MRSLLVILALAAPFLCAPSTAVAEGHVAEGHTQAGTRDREIYLSRQSLEAKLRHVARRGAWMLRRANPFARRKVPPTTRLGPLLTRRPVPGKVSSNYGMRRHPVLRRKKFHKGVDLTAQRHSPVVAAGPGVVRLARVKGAYGRLVILDHGLGLTTRYAHLQSIGVKHGQFLSAGAKVGTVGSSGRVTGPHLHFEVRQNGVPISPIRHVDFALKAKREKKQPARRRRRRRNRNNT